MKDKIHPQFNTNVKVTCACGNTFTTGSTTDELNVEICSNCHPFYTGKMRIVDTTNVVKKFEERRKGAKAEVSSRKERRQKKRGTRKKVVQDKGQKALTLKDMLSQLS